MGELPLNILYIHGFGSQYDPDNKKIQVLATMGTVYGVNVDYCRGFDFVYDTVKDAVLDCKPNLIVGTSMGGYTAACVGSAMGIPFVGLNPAVTPCVSLRTWIGNFTDYSGNDSCLTESIADTYPDISTDGYGLILLQAGDEVISAHATKEMLNEHYLVNMYPDGNHRFQNLENRLPDIQDFFARSQVSYGT